MFNHEMVASGIATIETGILPIAGVLALVIAGFDDE
jgi:hypothetical protein